MSGWIIYAAISSRNYALILVASRVARTDTACNRWEAAVIQRDAFTDATCPQIGEQLSSELVRSVMYLVSLYAGIVGFRLPRLYHARAQGPLMKQGSIVVRNS
jgi:hypothetical protein